MAKKKQVKRDQIIRQLEQNTTVLLPTDTMAEAGRKVLRNEFIRMLSHEAGSRTGLDLEDVHKMRVAIRQQRSIFRLLADYYKPKRIRAYREDLKHVMSALGAVRDLDVLIADLTRFGVILEAHDTATLRDVLESLDQRRTVARHNLVRVLDSKAYRRFVSSYTEFLTTPGAGAAAVDDDKVQPIEVRHVLPPMIYEHLAAVRAYDSVLADADAPTLHALRIEGKRLRYVVTLFSDLLGKEIDDFIDELRQLQDVLGHLNDITVARHTLTDLMEDLDGAQNAVLWIYLEQLQQEAPILRAQLPERWRRLNTKSVQRKLANAVLAL
jgi:CHAD domain-containing protein